MNLSARAFQRVHKIDRTVAGGGRGRYPAPYLAEALCCDPSASRPFPPLNKIHDNEIEIFYAGWPRSIHHSLQRSTPAKPS